MPLTASLASCSLSPRPMSTAPATTTARQPRTNRIWITNGVTILRNDMKSDIRQRSPFSSRVADDRPSSGALDAAVKRHVPLAGGDVAIGSADATSSPAAHDLSFASGGSGDRATRRARQAQQPEADRDRVAATSRLSRTADRMDAHLSPRRLARQRVAGAARTPQRRSASRPARLPLPRARPGGP